MKDFTLKTYKTLIKSLIARKYHFLTVEEFTKGQIGDVPAAHADVTDLIEDMGYKPETPIQEGIDRFVDWYLEFYGDGKR